MAAGGQGHIAAAQGANALENGQHRLGSVEGEIGRHIGPGVHPPGGLLAGGGGVVRPQPAGRGQVTTAVPDQIAAGADQDVTAAGEEARLYLGDRRGTFVIIVAIPQIATIRPTDLGRLISGQGATGSVDRERGILAIVPGGDQLQVAGAGADHTDRLVLGTFPQHHGRR